ncbi:putative transcriptional regulator, GntR family [Petrotoga mobilis SJ95]|uniref:Transcriptional regulator, GntR family n=1 Tax=Petrotoga mobilis (strain DSM 10674 / SJ95) TaxID=403833 RepID=A9BGD8_PETMO|nr:GntR family transcriptional regulator [Petrotoga mobilis]ABX31988.1 putative transcriptional regulator, GntR family [Petrotoga mobilis SJ95]
MNVFSLLNNFFRENEREKVSSSATKLYFFLIYEANKSYWEGPLMFSERKLSSLLSFSKNTVSKCLSELEDRGLITCYPRRVNSLTANKEDGLTANVEGKEAFSSTFWFADLQLRETASRQIRKEKKEVYNKGVRYNVHRGENSLAAHKENSLTANKGGSKYAKFF